MTIPERSRSESTTDVLSDLVLVALGTVICWWLATHFEWTERIFAWTRRSESFQLDEPTFVLLSLAIGLAWFAARRWRATQRELNARLAIQAKLDRTLDEQRRLARQFVDRQERERKRLSQELHDELGQFVNAIKIDAVSIRTAASNVDTTVESMVHIYRRCTLGAPPLGKCSVYNGRRATGICKPRCAKTRGPRGRGHG